MPLLVFCCHTILKVRSEALTDLQIISVYYIAFIIKDILLHDSRHSPYNIQKSR